MPFFDISTDYRRIFDEAAAKCEEILREHSDLLIATAEYLLVNETMNGEDFRYMCEHNGELPLPEKAPEVQTAEDALMDEIRAQAIEDAKNTEMLERTQTTEDSPESK